MIRSIYCDAAEPWAMHMQDSASTGYDSIVDLHDYICYWLLLILGLVISFAIGIFMHTSNLVSYSNMTHSTIVELIWTITPGFVLIAIAMPSFRALYMSDEIMSPNITIKAIAHQWYWSYSYDDIVTPVAYDSYMLTNDSLEPGMLRVLDVDNALVLPIGTIIRLLGTSTDVIHSFAVPSMGIKIDCMPGRLNQTTILANRIGTYFGQCSELCGAFHSFMPIRLDIVSTGQYLAWLKSQA